MLGGGSDPALRETAFRWIDRRTAGPVGVSLVVLGETFLEMTNDPALRPGADMSPFTRWLTLVASRKLEVCWIDHHHPRGDLLEFAERIRKLMVGENFGATDALILTCAIRCQSCLSLISTDKGMTSTSLTSLRRQRPGRQPLGILDHLPPF